MFFLSMALELTCNKCPLVNLLQLSIFAHAAVMNLIFSVDSVLGHELHDCERRKPVSLAAVALHSSKLTMRVAFMGRRGMQAADALSVALARTDFVQLGSSRWQVTDNRCSGCAWGSISTWADLTEPCSANWLEFNFATPTAITKSDGRGNRFVSVLPESRDVFGSLMERWKGLEGPKYAFRSCRLYSKWGVQGVGRQHPLCYDTAFRNAYKRVSSGRSRTS